MGRVLASPQFVQTEGMTLGGVLASDQVRLRAVDGGGWWGFTEKLDDQHLKNIRCQLSAIFTIQALSPIFSDSRSPWCDTITTSDSRL
jgi:hypothetical protein